MTRINTIPPQELSTKHLVAEYRELPRILRLAYNAEQKGYTPETYGIPEEFTLGKGHMKFFSNKLIWITRRFDLLVKEMQKRGHKTSFTSLEGLPAPSNSDWYHDWTPTEESKILIRKRIKERS